MAPDEAGRPADDETAPDSAFTGQPTPREAPPPGCIDFGNGQAAIVGTQADLLAVAEWLQRNYPDGPQGEQFPPGSGPVFNMTWTKLGDEFPAEARELADAEFRTHVEALCWSNFRLLDLRVPKADVRRFAESPDAAAAIDGLVAKGWWKDVGDEWDISLKFPEWQEERVVVDQRREGAALRKRRSRLHKAGDHSLCLPGGSCPHVTRDGTRDEMRDGTRRDGRVGSGPTDPPDPPFKGEDQNQDQELVGDSIADKEHPRQSRSATSPWTEDSGSDAQQIPHSSVQSPAADRNARGRPGPVGERLTLRCRSTARKPGR